MKPFVSILVPAYNAESWVADTLRSAIAQTWPRKEIILVDDGSSDRTLAIARQFESEGVRIVTQKNQGAAAARNKAFSLSHGDYIQWLDADDLLAPDKIARQMEVAEQSENRRTLLSSAWGHFMYRPYRAQFIPSALWCDLSPVEFLYRKLSQNSFMQTAAWLVSRELTEAAGSWDVNMLSDDDGEYFCRVILASDGVRFVPESKVYYRFFGYNTLCDVGRSQDRLDAQWRSMQLHIGYLLSLEDSERTRAAGVKYLQDWLVYFYPGRVDIVEQAEDLARRLGGQLAPPTLSWKYSWIRAILGWQRAKNYQTSLRRLRWYLEKGLDKALYRIERRENPTMNTSVDPELHPVPSRPESV